MENTVPSTFVDYSLDEAKKMPEKPELGVDNLPFVREMHVLICKNMS